MNRAELKLAWPKGCPPPVRYAHVGWSYWAEAQRLHGLKQTQCKTCKQYAFPQEKCGCKT